MFNTRLVPGKEGLKTLFDEEYAGANPGPVTCLGKTFDNDDARRAYFTTELREKLKDPTFREIEGFPIGEDEDILNLSDPPYYTACPNPFLKQFISGNGSMSGSIEKYKCEPFAADVSQGKNEPIYNVHSYPTKVPPGAILPLIEHFCREGDVVLDPFCGTGMTGVAAAESNKQLSVILQDLSPAATHISAAVQSGYDAGKFQATAYSILDSVRNEFGWMYSSNINGKSTGVRYFVWSDVYLCDLCGAEILIWDIEGKGSVGGLKEKVPCSSCGGDISKQSMTPKIEIFFDQVLNKTIQRIKSVPVLKVVTLDGGSKRLKKVPLTDDDLAILEKLNGITFPYNSRTEKMLFKDGRWGEQWRSSYHTGVTHSHHFYSYRNYLIISAIWEQIAEIKVGSLKSKLIFWFTASLSRATRLNRYMQQHNRHVGPLAGTLFIGPIQAEISPFYFFGNKVSDLSNAIQPLSRGNNHAVSTGSSSLLDIPDESVDFIFTDPPFGDNLIYSELNFFVESWLGLFTSQRQEAVIAKTQGKGLGEFESILKDVSAECYRVLKPGHWIVVEFHNSRNSVWTAIQEALGAAGFVVADVRTLDKKKGTTKQLTQAGTVKQDLIISAYKANGGLEDRFKLNAGTEDGVWEFVRTHLGNLPGFVEKNGKSEVIAERKEYLLYDRMLAFHVQRGVTVPYSAAEFYAGLSQRFSEREGMYFLPQQAANYDKKRIMVQGIEPLTLFVFDEASARQWLREVLKSKPQSFQDLHPVFLIEIGGWSKREVPLELSTLLEQNFLRYEGKDPVPEQIHAYLSTNWKELRSLPKDDPTLVKRARDRWYVPDPNKAGDLEKLREKALLKEFDDYKQVKKKLKVFRLEAVRAGFKKAWQDRDYATIIAVAENIPKKVLEEDSKLLMWYDQAVTRIGAE